MKQSAWTFNQYKIQFEKGIKVVTTFLQKENHNISQSWEHKQFWGRAEMFQQQKMTGENVPWMVFAHQGRAAVAVLLCREWSHPGYRMWNEGRAGPRLCSVTLRWLHCFFLWIASVILPVFFYSAVEQWLKFQVTAARHTWGQGTIQISRNTLTAEVEDPIANTPLFLWRRTLVIFGGLLAQTVPAWALSYLSPWGIILPVIA